MTSSYPFSVDGDEFRSKRVLVTGGTKGTRAPTTWFRPGLSRSAARGLARFSSHSAPVD
jgi:hypothetical protein